ncbi:MAG TPA: glutamine-hydrolyzing GMP synthase, partial [Gemmatimonadota bacterium]|nr:glutamine-hydrolyzing GMP synthase [Gemmatimonadota bacterium]
MSSETPAGGGHRRPGRWILILDFGSQYTQLIARRIRELRVYCEIHPFALDPETIRAWQPAGIILSGGPSSVYDDAAPHLAAGLLDLPAPILGICYGMHLLAQAGGAAVEPARSREYGRARVTVTEPGGLFQGFDERDDVDVWMSHGDRVGAPPAGYTAYAVSGEDTIAAFGDPEARRYGVQFHPEVAHTERGEEMLANFVFEICGCVPDWTMASFIHDSLASIRARIGDGRAVCGLSGGVDSAVAAALVHRAIGDRLVCIFVDTGLLRKDERHQVERAFREHVRLPLQVVDAADRFLADLAGV